MVLAAAQAGARPSVFRNAPNTSIVRTPRAPDAKLQRNYLDGSRSTFAGSRCSCC
jgi:hypothetical protein